jgi:DNA-binding response OmpR family regulator
VKVLVIEDEPKVASFIKEGLEEQHYMVDLAYDGYTGEKPV